MNINFYRLNKTHKYLKLFLDKNLVSNENVFLDSVASELSKQVDILQAINIDITTSQYVTILEKIKLICAELNVIFIVTDRCDMAILANTDGLLIPTDGLNLSFCRHLLGKEKIIGIEISNKLELQSINSAADYIILKDKALEEEIKSLNIPYFIDTIPSQGNNLVYLYHTYP